MWINSKYDIKNSDIMKKFKIIIIIFSAIIFFYIFFYPQKICNKNDNVRVDRIVYNTQFGSDDDKYDRMEIENYDSDEIVNCISKYKSYLTLSRSTGYLIANSELEVFLTLNGKGKHIILGNINYEASNYGQLRRNIIDADGLKKELKLLLGLDK